MKELRHHGIHVQLRDDGDFFINASAAGVTLGEAESWEFLAGIHALFEGRARTLAGGDQADADAFNNADYNNGTAPVIETGVEYGPREIIGQDGIRRAAVLPTAAEVEVHKVDTSEVVIPTEVGAPVRRKPGRPRKVQPTS